VWLQFGDYPNGSPQGTAAADGSVDVHAEVTVRRRGMTAAPPGLRPEVRSLSFHFGPDGDLSS
jgi:hypothetical protein